MSRQVQEANLQVRAARQRLRARAEPYWRALEEGRHLGYFKGLKRSRWVARMRVPSGDELVYLTYRLALCDDSEEADGDRILNWSQAKQKAEHWFASQLRAGSKTRIGPQTIKLEEAATALNELTVKEAVDAYVTMRDARDKARIGRAVKSDAHRLKLHVLEGSELGHLPLDSLSEDNLRAWTDGLADMKASTRKRLVNDFKAALNDTYRRHRKVLPPDFAIIIRHGLVAQSVPEGEADSGVRENQILTDQQVARLIATSMSLDPDGDAARVIILLAATGARFSQLRRMQVRDVQCDQSRLMAPPPRKGKGKTVSRIRVQVGADVLAALEPILVSRPASATLLERWRHKQTAPATWVRADRGAWQTASELTRFWKKVADQENLPNLVPYALRHSSIVRGIRVGLPIRLVAALHDTSVAMIERHYSRWITEGLDDLAAKAVVPLITMTDAAVSDSEADSGPD